MIIIDFLLLKRNEDLKVSRKKYILVINIIITIFILFSSQFNLRLFKFIIFVIVLAINTIIFADLMKKSINMIEIEKVEKIIYFILVIGIIIVGIIDLVKIPVMKHKIKNAISVVESSIADAKSKQEILETSKIVLGIPSNEITEEVAYSVANSDIFITNTLEEMYNSSFKSFYYDLNNFNGNLYKVQDVFENLKDYIEVSSTNFNKMSVNQEIIVIISLSVTNIICIAIIGGFNKEKFRL